MGTPLGPKYIPYTYMDLLGTKKHGEPRIMARMRACRSIPSLVLVLSEMGVPLILAHITLGRKKDPFFINIKNPIPQKV